MWIDGSDTTQLAQRLRLGPKELLETLGGPWQVVRRDTGDEILAPGTLFVGRAGPSVAILVSDDPSPLVEVGVARGAWINPGTLAWSLAEPVETLVTPERDAPSLLVDRFLAALGTAVDAAFAAKAPSLVTCRYCGSLVAPEHALREDTCHGCGTSVFGVVY
jgi:hypothetical protein